MVIIPHDVKMTRMDIDYITRNLNIYFSKLMGSFYLVKLGQRSSQKILLKRGFLVSVSEITSCHALPR